MAKIDISKLRDLYPNYAEGADISPMILVESMVILQNQESNLAHLTVEASAAVDSVKFELDKKNKEISSFIDKCSVELISADEIPKDFRKNQDLTLAFIKHGSDHASEYETLIEEAQEIEKKLLDAKILHKKYDTLSNVVHNGINTAIQLLSYLKHQERMDNDSRNI